MKPSTIVLYSLGLALSLALAPGAVHAEGPAHPPGSRAKPRPRRAAKAEATRPLSDEALLSALRTECLRELEAARYAESHAQDAELRTLAGQIVGDHARLERQASELAARQGVVLTTRTASEVAAEQRAVGGGAGGGAAQGASAGVEALRGLTGAPLDRAYLTMVEARHAALLRVLRAERSHPRAHPKALADAVREAIPVLEKHHQRAARLLKKLGGAARAS